MKKKYEIKKYIFLLILTILLIVIFTSTNMVKNISNLYNIIIENILITKDKNMITDDMTKTYIKDLEKQNNELKSINGIEKEEYSYVNATVIYRNPMFWYDTLTINKGIKDGVKIGDMVINKFGLIGTVIKVFNDSSLISIITNINKDKKITVAISDGETISYGIISSYNKYKNELVVSELTTDIKYNDELNVITTNFTNSFKEGIIIGKVKKIEDDTNGLSKNAIITPILNYNDIKYVCVVGVKWYYSYSCYLF